MSFVRGAILYLIYAAVVVLFCWSMQAVSEPIDIEKISKEKGWSNTIEASYKSKKGFEDKVEVFGEMSSQYFGNRELYVGIFNASKDTKNGKPDGRSNLQHLRYRKILTSRLGYESYLQREVNTDKDLEQSYLYGSGPFYLLHSTYSTNITIGAALVAENEKYFSQDNNVYANRLYNYISGSLTFPEKIMISSMVHAEPKIGDLDNYRIYTRFSLKYRLRSNITSGINFNRIDNTHPAPGVSKSHQETKTTIGVEF